MPAPYHRRLLGRRRASCHPLADALTRSAINAALGWAVVFGKLVVCVCFGDYTRGTVRRPAPASRSAQYAEVATVCGWRTSTTARPTARWCCCCTASRAGRSSTGRMMPVLAAAGLRAIAPDLVGFGRSDKPADPPTTPTPGTSSGCAPLAFDALDLREVTLVGQDWGGLIGLRLVAEHPDRFARVVAANTGLPTGDQPMPECGSGSGARCEHAPTARRRPARQRRLPDAACRTRCCAAYDAPFPDEASRPARGRCRPRADPPDDPASAANRAAWEALARFGRAVPGRVQRRDPITGGDGARTAAGVPGARGSTTRRSRAPGTSCRRTPASGWPR